MSAEREAGFTALKNGSIPEAITYLERAVAASPGDFQALLYLGAAYGQAGRHTEAVGSLSQAVSLQPSSAPARYNLALAYDSAGHIDYALTAAQQALQLQPDYAQAQALVARLSGAPAPQQYSQTQTQPQMQYVQPTAPSPYGQPQQQTYGQQQPVQPQMPYGQPGGTTGQYGGAPSNQGQGAAAYGGAPAANAYNPYASQAGNFAPDKFDMKQAIIDWKRVIMEPNAFYREQAQRQGYNAPLSFLVAFGLAVAVISLLSAVIRIVMEPSTAATALLQAGFGLVGGVTGALMGAFVWGGVLHVGARLFGGRAPYHATFRVAAYARAPMLFFSLIIALLSPFIVPLSSMGGRKTTQPSPFGQVISVQYSPPSSSSPGGTTFPVPGQSPPGSGGGKSAPNPFDDPAFQRLMGGSGVILLISLLGMIWPLCLETIGLRYAQNLSTGGAVGTVIVAVFVPILIGVVLMVLFIGLIGAAMSSARSGLVPPEVPLTFLRHSLAVWHGH